MNIYYTILYQLYYIPYMHTCVLHIYEYYTILYHTILYFTIHTLHTCMRLASIHKHTQMKVSSSLTPLANTNFMMSSPFSYSFIHLFLIYVCVCERIKHKETFCFTWKNCGKKGVLSFQITNGIFLLSHSCNLSLSLSLSFSIFFFLLLC